MADNVIFEDYTIKVQAAMNDKIIAGLEEAAGELVSQVKQNSRVGKINGGKTKGSFRHYVDESTLTAVIGSPDENAIWEEFGTGEYAITENGGKGGRKGYWVFVKGSDGKDDKDPKSYTLQEAKKVMAILRSKGLEAYYTNGKKPTRAFWKAYKTKKKALIRIIESKLKGL